MVFNSILTFIIHISVLFMALTALIVLDVGIWHLIDIIGSLVNAIKKINFVFP